MDDDDFLEENFKDIELTDDILNAIENILPSDDPLDKPNFDTVDYINELFPTEQSLSNIDDVILQVKSKIRRIDDDVRGIIHSQTTVGQDGKIALDDAQKAIIHLFSQIKEIKIKAEKSEDMVKEITRDIKQLDIAKKNLTLSITILNHLFILVEGVESLESLSNKSQYDETSVVFQRVNNVIDHFEPYMHLKQISDLSNRVKAIKNELSVKVKREFEESFSNPFTKLNIQHGSDLCKMVDVLDQKLRNDLIKWFIKQELNEYLLLFQENQENSWLDKIDKRYSWIKRTLAEFEEKFNKIFPASWEMSERLAVEFCEITRRELANIMLKRKIEIDMKLLMFAIQRTATFEQLLSSRFIGKSIPKPNDVTDENWKPFNGIISQCFEGHFDTYISYTENALTDIVNRFLEDIKTNGFPRMETEESSNVHGSSADLFVFYKNCMTQCMQLFPSTHLLVKLAATFQKYLREYSNKVLTTSLPKVSANTSFSTAATSLIQNFQIQTILKEAQSVANSDSKKLLESEICKICSILCTAEYCLETIQQLEDKLKEKVGKTISDKISFSNEVDVFSGLISNCIQILVQDLENSCDPALIAMIKLPWQNIEVVGDQSSYINAITNHIKTIVPLIRDNLANSRKYFTQFCVKFVNNLIPKFINNLFKCKLTTQSGIEQLLLDTHSLKTVLLDLPNINSQIARKAPASYTKIVIKGMSRAELLLKCVMAPSEPIQAFVDNYIKLMNDYDINTFRMLVEMKGITKRSDLNNFIEIFKTKIPSNTSNGLSSASTLSSSTLNNNNNNITSDNHDNQDMDNNNRLKQFDKLQDLIRKKL